MANTITLIAFMDSEHTRGCDVSKGMSGLRHFFVAGLRDTEVFDSDRIKAAKSGMTLTNRAIRSIKVQRERLPTPFFFIAWARHHYWLSGDVDRQMAYRLRSNEYCHDDRGKGKSALRSVDVFYVTESCERYLAHDERIRGIATANIVTATAEVSAGKTMKKGRSRKLFLDRRTSPIEAQLLEDLFDFSKASGINENDLFFSRYKKGRNKRLVPKMISALLKAGANEFGLPEAMLSSHCNRIWCATDLRCYGYEDKDLCRFIGWRSSSSLLEVRSECSKGRSRREDSDSRRCDESCAGS
jgi:hypothetical protein